MPHKDRAARLAYLRAWKLRNRPAPVVKPQAPDLPPIGAMVYSEDGELVQCHECGRWLGSLNNHLKLHSYTGATYKEAYGLGRTQSLTPPAVQQRLREAAIARDQGAVGRDHLPHDGSGRPPGQEARLAVRVQASAARAGIHTRGGNKTRGKQP